MRIEGSARAFLLLVLLAHASLSLFVIRAVGIWSLFPPFAELSTWQIFSDLGASSAIVLILIHQELKRRRRKTTKPILLLAIGILLSGSIAPLIYLLASKDFRET